MRQTSDMRVQSIDVLRGLACVLMAVDHVRVYADVPAWGTDPGVFLTRWITHFVAPVFCFFAGSSAFLMGRSHGDMPRLARFLMVRGLLLVVLELTVIRFLWTFNMDYGTYLLGGVIWMLGWCMVVLGIAVRWPPRTVGLVGVAIVVAQPVFALPPQGWPAIAPWWAFLYPSGADAALGITVLYVLVPWVGVMAAGYGFGAILLLDDETRRQRCRRIGGAATVIFLVAAATVAWVKSSPDDSMPLWMRMLAQQKYPASLLFLLMTLGPAILVLPWAESARGPLARVAATFGRVPMFYYLLHIPAIHLAAMLVSLLRSGTAIPELIGNFPMFPPTMPDGYRWSLGLLYLVWALVVFVVLYPACRWYGALKARAPRPWMRFI